MIHTPAYFDRLISCARILFLLLFSFTSFSQVVTTFNFTGGNQTYTVPPCVTSIQYTVRGAQGGSANGGQGAVITGNLTVTPGQVLQIRVGGQGTCPAGGWNGGGAGINATNISCGGGGASDIRATPYALANRLVVAGGGGGGGYGNPANIFGGAGGCATGSAGGSTFGLPGLGGTQTAGGNGGAPWAAPGTPGLPGALGIGGNGGTDNCASLSHGGGGGGGFYGGGGGGPDCWAGGAPFGGGGGGGGSSLTPAGGACTAGSNTGNGLVVITIPSAPTSTITSTATTICNGTNFTISGTITATGAWTLTLSDGSTTTGTGNGTWNIVVSPTTTTTYTVTNIVDAVRCTTNPPGSVTLTLPTAGTNLSLNNESATCLVNQNGFIHFYHSSGRLIASVNSLGQNLGNVTMTSYLDVTNQVMFDCNAPTNPSFETAVMQRHWVITPSIQPTTPVQVRLPFQNGELTTLTTVSGANANINDNVPGITSLKLSKYSGPANVDNNAPNNCPSAGGNAGTTIHTQVANGNTTVYSGVTGASYSDHSVPSFSEFWLHGSFNNSPLPIVLESFSVDCEKGSSLLKWVTSSEQNSDLFEIERSENGFEWEVISQMNAAGNSYQTINYSYQDFESRNTNVVYYRLVLINQDGVKETFDALSSNCVGDLHQFYLYPNPGDNKVKIVTSEEGSNLVFRDTKGRIVKNIQLSESGNQMVEISISDLSIGSYFVEFIMENGKKDVIRFVKK